MTDLTAPLIEPDLEAGQPKEEVKVKPDEPQEWHDDVWSYNLFGISVDGLLWKHRLIRMTSRLGYERSLLDRCYLRFWLLPAVAASVIIAEGYSRDWSYMTMAWENTFFMSLIGLAMLQPAVNSVYDWLDDQGYSERLGIRFRPHVLFPDICLAAAAFEHTRRGMYNLLEETNWGTKGSVSYAERGILCSEHLVMFWVVVLPLIAGRRIYVLGMYSGALAVWHYYTGLPGLGTFCAGAILLVPVLIVEITTSGVYDELHRCSMGISALSKGTGGGTCVVDWESGRIVEASPDLIDWWGDYSPRMRFEELFRDPEDKDEMFEAFSFNPFPYIWEPRGRGENGYSTRDFFKRLGHWEERKKVSHVGEEFKVTSMRCAHTADGTVSARVVPIWKIAGRYGQQITKLWIEIKHPPPSANCLAEREAAVLEREQAVAKREKEASEKKAFNEELCETLKELHQKIMLQQQMLQKREEEAKQVPATTGKTPETQTPPSARAFCSADGGPAPVTVKGNEAV